MANRIEVVDGLAGIFRMIPNAVATIDRSLLELGYREYKKRGRGGHQMSPMDVSMTTLALTMAIGTKGRIRAMECLMETRHVSYPDINLPKAFASVLEHIAQGETVRPYISFSQLERCGEVGLLVDGAVQIHRFSGDENKGGPPHRTRITLFQGLIQDISGLVTPSYCEELSDIFDRLSSSRIKTGCVKKDIDTTPKLE